MTSLLFRNMFNQFSDFRELSTTKFPTYQAYDTDLNQQVVLKCFPAISPDYHKYSNEKSYLQNLSHPHVIKLIQAVDMAPVPTKMEEEEESVSYLVLEHARYGDFLNIIDKCGKMPDKLARTFFHQLIDALEYLHSQNVAHLDLKLENLLLDDDYRLRIADFDLSQELDSSSVQGKGTKGYRAPEIKKGVCKDLRAADLFSIGVILFTFITGNKPFEEPLGSSSLGSWYGWLQKNNRKFWESHCLLLGREDLFSDELKSLINCLLMEKPENRPTIDTLRQSDWYRGEVIPNESYIEEIERYIQGHYKH